MSVSPSSPTTASLPASPPPPHPDSKISPASATSDSKDDKTEGRLQWRDLQQPESAERRPSVQFSTDRSEALLRSESPVPKAKAKEVRAGARRLSSPPPPPAHQQRVSFDTFANPDVNTWSYSFRSDHKDYDYSSTGRTFLVGTDENDYSDYALEWLMDEMVDDNDMVICLRVVLKEPKSISTAEEKRYKAEASKLLKHLQGNAGERKIALILEYAAGKVQENIMRMIELYEPNFLVVGTRGRNLNGFQGLLPGSVSKWCVQNSPIPVVVARKESKRKKAKAARQADPNRRSYQALLAATGGHTSTSNILASHGHGALTPDGTAGQVVSGFDGNSMTAANLSLVANSQTEADLVARAIGLPTEYSASTILKRRSSRASTTSAGSAADSSSAYNEGLALRRESTGRSEDDGLESPSPTGPLRDETDGYFYGDAEDSEGEALSRQQSTTSNMVVPEVRLERQATDLAQMDKENS